MTEINDPVLETVTSWIQQIEMESQKQNRKQVSVPVKLDMLHALALGKDMTRSPYAVRGRSAFYSDSKIAERIVLDKAAFYFICTMEQSTPMARSICKSFRETIINELTYAHVLEVPCEIELSDSTPQSYFESICDSYAALAGFDRLNTKLIHERKQLARSLRKIQASDELRSAITVSEKNEKILRGALDLFQALEELQWD